VRNALVGSGIVHLVVMVAMFVFRISSPAIMANSDVMRVALVEMPPVKVKPRPRPVVEKEPEKVVRLKPTDETGVKVTPKKPPPKKEPPKKQEEPPKEAEPEPTETVVPYTSLGAPGMKGQISVDAANFEFTYYLLLVRNRIAENWSPPAGLVTRGQPVRAVVYFRITRHGAILLPQLEDQSGVEFFDRSALRAVRVSDPMPPLPVGFDGSELGVHFGFEFTAP